VGFVELHVGCARGQVDVAPGDGAAVGEINHFAIISSPAPFRGHQTTSMAIKDEAVGGGVHGSWFIVFRERNVLMQDLTPAPAFVYFNGSSIRPAQAGLARPISLS
jgi:hypothetical protein